MPATRVLMLLRTAPALLSACLLALPLIACGASCTPSETPPASPPPAAPAPSASVEAPSVSAAPSASAAPAPADPPAPAAATPAARPEDQARIDFAVEFVSAVAKRDKAAQARLLAVEDFCKVMLATAKKAPPGGQKGCEKEMVAGNKEGLDAYNTRIPPTFEAGAAEVLPIAPDKGIWMVLVRPKGFDRHGPNADKEGASVMLLEAEGKRFVVFAHKKKEGPSQKK